MSKSHYLQYPVYYYHVVIDHDSHKVTIHKRHEME